MHTMVYYRLLHHLNIRSTFLKYKHCLTICFLSLPRTLCDNLRRERDRAVSDLADALRNLDDMRKQKNDALRELKELKSVSTMIFFFFFLLGAHTERAKNPPGYTVLLHTIHTVLHLALILCYYVAFFYFLAMPPFTQIKV